MRWAKKQRNRGDPPARRRGATVTVDAIGCQRDVARAVTERGWDYVLALKQREPALHARVKALLNETILGGFVRVSHRHLERSGPAHGRAETRGAWVSDEVRWLDANPSGPVWPAWQWSSRCGRI